MTRFRTPPRGQGPPLHTEFGDFQTPPPLAEEVCALLALRGVEPGAIIEPACGRGNFISAALRAFPRTRELIGLEVNEAYAAEAAQAARGARRQTRARVLVGSFFSTDWPALLGGCPEPILVVGNPPWVTNSALGAIDGRNLPEKTNSGRLPGLSALTGKSNFDISEWILSRLIQALSGRRACLAMLCKTVVARRVMARAWQDDLPITEARVFMIDAARHFSVTVDACLLVCDLGTAQGPKECSVRGDLTLGPADRVWAHADNRMVADLEEYRRCGRFLGPNPAAWRSGVKHDCSRVMELTMEGDKYRNGLGELARLEDEFLFPMLKAADVANGRASGPSRFMLVTQTGIGEDTSLIRERAPRTWAYLLDHGELLDARKSSIYRERPRFSVFGVGPYAFSAWKVAVSGMHKDIAFAKVGTMNGKPIVLDDTCYFLPCEDEAHADRVERALNSAEARRLFSALVFRDSKRPVTAELLSAIDLSALCDEVCPAR